jgi:hypothetical protein
MNRQHIEDILRSPSRLERGYARFERRPDISTGRVTSRPMFSPGLVVIAILLILGFAVASRLPFAPNGVGGLPQTSASPQPRSSSGVDATGSVPTAVIAIGPGVTVDGFVLGAQEACSNPVGAIDPKYADSSCSGMLDLATAALDARDPGHAAIASIGRYADGTQPGPIDVTGNSPVPTAAASHLGPDVTVFIFTLVDGSVRATGVACADSTSCIGVGSYPR